MVLRAETMVLRKAITIMVLLIMATARAVVPLMVAMVRRAALLMAADPWAVMGHLREAMVRTAAPAWAAITVIAVHHRAVHRANRGKAATAAMLRV